jgi:DNA-binding CsgD family transcriptional regulator
VLRLFGSATTLSPLSNLVVLWQVTLLLPMAMVTALMGIAVPPLAGLLAVPTLALTRSVIGAMYGIAALPHVTLQDSGLMELWVLLLCLVLWLIWRGLLRGRGRILACAALGATNAEIASQLGLREGTVKAYLGSAMSKLDASTRHAAVTKARRAGLLP